MAAFISLAEKPYPKLVQMELKSALMRPVGTALTSVPETINPFFQFYGAILFLGTLLLCAARITSDLFLANAA